MDRPKITKHALKELREELLFKQIAQERSNDYKSPEDIFQKEEQDAEIDQVNENELDM